MTTPEDRRPSSANKTPVVTAFIWDGRRILLALRSDRVSTFPGHWAGISGYLEGEDPVGWAFVEIEEETGLSRSQLTLLRIGQPLEAADADTGRVFEVHPFLLSVPSGLPVRSDWEAARLEWVDMAELRDRRRRPVVPRLYEAFARVWPPWPARRAVEANRQLGLHWLATDRRMGAGTLARSAGAEVVKLARLCSEREFVELRGELTEAIDALATVRPSMAAVANMMEDVNAAMAGAVSRESFLQAVQRLIDRSHTAEQTLARHMAQRLGPGTSVMTVSYSSTVRRALHAAADHLRRVYVCESRPLLEGRRLAGELAEAGIPVTVLTEAQVHLLMPQVDLVLLGADSVVPGRGAVNKVGSVLVALAAQQLGRPVLIAAESLKRRRGASAEPPPSESGLPDEVWPEPPLGVDVSNVYFEWIPDRWITEYVDEHADASD